MSSLLNLQPPRLCSLFPRLPSLSLSVAQVRFAASEGICLLLGDDLTGAGAEAASDSGLKDYR